MAGRSEHIQVTLTPEQDQLARRIGNLRRDRAEKLSLKSDGTGDWRATDILGAQGEVAFAAYRGCPPPDPAATEVDDRRRGYDVDGYQVRTARHNYYGLNLKRKDRGAGRFALLLGYEAPAMWLVGWIDADEGLALGDWRQDGVGDPNWCRVDPIHLHPFPEQNGYARRGEGRWLVDPQTPFWCEECGGMHPIIGHRQCRS